MDWSLLQQKYMLWLAVPTKNRPANLKNREQVATTLGVDVATLLSWEGSAGFWDDSFAISRSLIGHRLADILEANAREAVRGSVPAMKLAYQVLGVASERIEHKLSMEDDQLVVVMRNAPDSALTKRSDSSQASPTDATPVPPSAEAKAAAAVASGLMAGLVASTVVSNSDEGHDA